VTRQHEPIRLWDEELARKVRRIATTQGVEPAEALEFLVRHGLVYLEKLEYDSPYRRPGAPEKR